MPGMLNEDDLFGLSKGLKSLVTFACSHMTRSYKAVVLAALMQLVDDSARASVDALAHQFHGFYLNREMLGQPVERRPFALDPPSGNSMADVLTLLWRYPLERFRRAGHVMRVGGHVLSLLPASLWQDIGMEERMQVWNCCQRALRRYYERLVK